MEDSTQQQQKILSVEDIMKRTKLGYQWRQGMNIKNRLRPSNAIRREVMVGNYCKVKEFNDRFERMLKTVS